MIHIRSALNGASLLLLMAAAAAHAESQAPIRTDADPSQPGAALYAQRCAVCHDVPVGRVPPRVTMLPLTPEYVERILTTGVMQPQAAGLTSAQIRDLATFVTNKPFGTTVEPDPRANQCQSSPPLRAAAGDWNRWGLDDDNSRFQRQPGFAAGDIPRLKVKWVFAYPGRGTYAQPTVAGGRLYVASVDGHVFSLDAQTGCTHWHYVADAAVKTAITVVGSGSVPGGYAAYFGDERGVFYAVNASTGEPLWKVRIEEHPLARVIGAPLYFEGRLYVPVASQEELASRDLGYPCCTFRGSIVALDAEKGSVVWKRYLIDGEPQPWTAPSGRRMFAPAGVAIWNAMALDPRRRMIYAGTGNSYAFAPAPNANSVIGVDLATGALLWVNQVQKDDNWTTGCWRPKNENCPATDGPDNDFASATIMRERPDGRRLVIAAQKSGHVYAFDPEQNGRLLWHTQPSEHDIPAAQADDSDSGILYGMAADDRHVYAARIGKGGVTAFRLDDGQQVWRTPAPEPRCAWGEVGCSAGQGSAAIVIPGAVFAGSSDGHIRAYATDDGGILWDFDTAAQPYDAVNGVQATGGTIRGASQVVAHGMLYVNSGYIHPRAGNALIAFSVDGR